MDIHLANITKTYPLAERPALQLDELRLHGGKVHGILGESGSGKSTLLNLLALLDRPDDNRNSVLRFHPKGIDNPGHGWGGKAEDHAGHALIPHNGDDEWRRKYYSFVFQSGYLQENFTVRDNVLMPLRLQGALTPETIARAEQRLDTVGIERDKWGDLPRQLSGGQYQRVAVARALSHEPHVVFADEPTGSLDSGRGKEVMEALIAWKNERPGSNLLVLVTHDANNVKKYCDHVSVLRDGRVIMQGSKDALDFAEIQKAMSGESRPPAEA